MDADLESQKNTKSQRVSWLDSSETPEPTDADPFLEAARATSERLEIIEQIGKGGMAVVYKAQHMVMNKLVAVKLLLPHLTSDPTSLKRFQQEAQATATLTHPNIVHIHDCGLSNGQAFIIMDYVAGNSLEKIVREQPLTPERAVDVFVQISEALNHAHERGIIHRDLKPSNVMLTTDKNGFDVVKVVDFGIAKLLTSDDGETMNNLTQTGDVFGSPLYMSPEQSVGGKIDKRSDIYSLGCLMYEALAGRPPIVGKNFLDTMQRHSTDVPRPFADKSDSALLTRLQTIVFTCMAKSPADRYQDMKTIARDLRDAAAGKSSTTSGGWVKRERPLAQIIKKESKQIRILKIAALSAVSLTLMLSIFVAADAIRKVDTPSPYASSPLFKLVSVPRPTLFDNYEAQKQNIILSVDRNEASDEVHKEDGLETAAHMYYAYGKWKEAQHQYTRLLKLPVGLEKQGDYHLGLGLCALAQNNLNLAKDEFRASIDYYLKLQNGYQNSDEHPDVTVLLSGIYGIKARQPVSYLALTEELRGDLVQAAANARVLVVSGRADDDERPATYAYIADLNRRMHKFETAVVTFQNLKTAANSETDVDYRTKLCFAIGLCLLGANEPARAATVLNEGLELGSTDKEMLAAMDHEYHRALWESGQKLRAFTDPHKLNVLQAVR
ncbi:MAG TPA: protein kinase [Drouetiella sp.]